MAAGSSLERVKDGALGGLSIGYKVKPGGAIIGKEAGRAEAHAHQPRPERDQPSR